MTEDPSKDKIINGIGLGISCGSILFLLLRYFEKLVCYLLNLNALFTGHRMSLIILLGNMLLFRWLVITKNRFETGRGVFLITFIASIFYIIKFKVRV